MKSGLVSVGDHQLNVVVRAGSPSVLFLHGLAGHGGEWNLVIGHLSAETGIINPDQRNHAGSWVPGVGNAGSDGYIGDAVSLIEQFASGPVVVVGQSMGSLIATLVAHERPDLVAHLVLIEGGMAATTDSELASLRRWFDSWPQSFADRSEATEFFGADKRSTPAWVNGLAATETGLTRCFDPDAMIDTMRALASESRWRQWQQLRVPRTLIRASNSMITDADIAQMLELQPDTQLIVMPDSGHDVHLDRPEQVGEVLRNVVASVGDG